MRHILAAVVFTLVSATTAAPETYVVNPEGTGDFPTIQAAINAASHWDVVELTDGVFSGDGNRDIDFLGKLITVRSQNDNPDSCIIDCEGAYLDPHRGFSFLSGEEPGSVVMGITIANGYVRGPEWQDNAGGGILMWDEASPRILHCIFRNNHAARGGAVYCRESETTVANCTFWGNTGTERGGGIDCHLRSSPEITSCTFYRNSSPDGSAVNCRYESPVSITHTIIAFGEQGEAVHCSYGGTATLSCCDVFGNAGGDWIACIQGQCGINGNISEDPLFCDPYAGNFRLQEGSPCAPDYNPDCGLIGAWHVGCEPHVPTTYVVNPDGTGDFPTIQAAIDAAFSGDVIELTNGTFTGEGNRDLNLGWKWLTVRSQSGNPDSCIIDCQGSEPDPHRGFYFCAATSPGTVVEGITVANGYHSSCGGGLYFESCSPWVVNCVVRESRAHQGGGIYCEAGRPTLEGCSCNGNAASGSGGGMFCDDGGAPILVNCRFEENTAANKGGGMHSRNSAGLDLSHCQFSGNSALSGGAISFRDDELAAATYCMFSENDALWGYGGAVYCEGGSPSLQYSTFVRNLSPQGGAACCRSSAAAFANCTFSENVADQGAGIWCQGDEVMVENSIIAFSGYGDAVHCANDYSAVLMCCDVYGNAGGDWVGCIAWMAGLFGNISKDPLFCGDLNPLLPYLLHGRSPCAPDYNPDCGLMGAWPVGCGTPQAAEEATIDSWRLSLDKNIPNPFASSTRITYRVPKGMGSGPVFLNVYDASGRLLRTLVDGSLPAGTHSVSWDGADDAGKQVEAGIYFYRLRVGQDRLTRQMVLVK